MATKSKHRKNHKAKVQSRNNQKLQEKKHHTHRLTKMFAEMLKEQQENITKEDTNVTDVILPETVSIT